MGKFDKNPEIEITAENPFQNDLFNRKELIESLSRLITSMERPFVLSIEAPWGAGKTTFIQMWQKELIKQEKVVLSFNAWENDYSDDPFANLMISLSNQISKGYKELGISNLFKNLVNTTGKLVSLSLPIILGILSRGIINQKTSKSLCKIFKSSDIEKLVSTTSSELVETIEKQIEANTSFKNELSDLSKILEKKNKKPLIIFIDELDRCRPDFALSLLERIKHLFSVDGIVFVLSIERKQLENSLKAIYGGELDVQNYLRRFIDLRITLENNKDNVIEFVKKEIHKIGLADILKLREADYEFFGELLNLFANNFSIELRAIKQIIYNFNIIERTLSPPLKTMLNNGRFRQESLLLLIILKSINEEMIFELSKGNIISLQEFEKNHKPFIYENDELLDWGWFYGQVIPYSKISGEISQLQNAIETLPYSTNDNRMRNRKLESLKDQIRYLPQGEDLSTLLVNAINFTNLIIQN